MRNFKDVLSSESIFDFLNEYYAVFMPSPCSIQSKEASPSKYKDPGHFIITIKIGGRPFKALCDLGASASLIPLTIWDELDMGELTPVNMRISMADGSCSTPSGFVEDIPVQLDKYFIPDDFVIADIREDKQVPIILGRPFLATVRANINVREGRMTFNIGGEVLEYVMEKCDTPP